VCRKSTRGKPRGFGPAVCREEGGDPSGGKESPGEHRVRPAGFAGRVAQRTSGGSKAWKPGGRSARLRPRDSRQRQAGMDARKGVPALRKGNAPEGCPRSAVDSVDKAAEETVPPAARRRVCAGTRARQTRGEWAFAAACAGRERNPMGGRPPSRRTADGRSGSEDGPSLREAVALRIRPEHDGPDAGRPQSQADGQRGSAKPIARYRGRSELWKAG
jgi:hypothetical protein